MTNLQQVAEEVLGPPIGEHGANGESRWPCPNCGGKFRTLPHKREYKDWFRCFKCEVHGDQRDLMDLFAGRPWGRIGSGAEARKAEARPTAEIEPAPKAKAKGHPIPKKKVTAAQVDISSPRGRGPEVEAQARKAAYKLSRGGLELLAKAHQLARRAGVDLTALAQCCHEMLKHERLQERLRRMVDENYEAATNGEHRTNN